MQADFSGQPATVWLTETSDDRRMQLLEDFWFRDRKGEVWHAAKGTSIDGASIPRPLWSLVGSPYSGDYRRASIVHDVACAAAATPSERRRADKMFFEACRAGGCSWLASVTLYVGVRIGAWYQGALRDQRPKLTRDALDRQVELDFSEVAQRVLEEGAVDDAEVVELRTDLAFSQMLKNRQLVLEKVSLAALERPSHRSSAAIETD